GAVVVGITGDAEAHRAFDEGVAQRMMPVDVGHCERTVLPAQHRVARADAPFEALEIGQHVGITPAMVAALRPAVEIEPLAAIVDEAVDRARSAERLAAWRKDAAA